MKQCILAHAFWGVQWNYCLSTSFRQLLREILAKFATFIYTKSFILTSSPHIGVVHICTDTLRRSIWRGRGRTHFSGGNIARAHSKISCKIWRFLHLTIWRNCYLASFLIWQVFFQVYLSYLQLRLWSLSNPFPERTLQVLDENWCNLD